MEEKNKKTPGGFWSGVLAGAMAVLLLGACVVGVTSVVSLVHVQVNVSEESDSIQNVLEDSGSDVLGDNEGAFNQELESKLSEINQIIDSTFIFDVDSEEMMNGALDGYMSGLNDVYSVYYTPEEYADTMEDSDGTFVGIGVSVQQATDTMIITAMTVYSGSPAEEGGMKDGDIITAVDGLDISGEELTDVVNMIRGESGTQVVVTVYRDGEYLDLTMTRRSIEKETVTYELMDDKIGYIKLTEFDSVSVDQMKTAIQDLQDQGMKSLVLDLRNNPGGLLTSVIHIADQFLPECNIFYYEDKQGQQTRYDSTANQLCTEPMVVLINGNSASASEVLAGSLKDQERAQIVGEQSFGKGIVQSFYELSDGSAIKLTTAHYFTPNGTDIHGVGIEPTISVEDDKTTEDIDEQLQAAIDALK